MKRISLFLTATLLLLALILPGMISASAEDMLYEGTCGEGVNWTLNINTGELIITGDGAMTDYGGSNGSTPWYSHRDSIQSVTLWDGVTALGNYAFFNCRNLTEVVLPAGITEIPASAFAGCSKLNQIELPDSMTAIGDSAFFRCSSLSQIQFPAGIQIIGSSAFSNCTSLTELTLPVGVTTIGDQAFASCGKLTTVSLPNTLTTVGDGILAGTTPDKVLFYGAEAEWQDVALGENNANLTSALIIHPDHVYDRENTDYAYLMSGADCENPEIYYKSCACGEMGEETFTHGSPMGHTGGTATCMKLAVCAICWKEYGEPAPHTPDSVVSCLNDVHCTLCEELLEEALGHEHAPTVTPPTCTEEGYTTHTCVRGDDIYVDTYVPATGHTEGDAATCTNDQLCTVCGEVLVPRLGHDHLATVTLHPTCTEQGIMTYTCSRCEDTYTRPIAPNGHTSGGEATCTEPEVCTVCSARLTDKLGHNYGTVVVEPTCTERGYTVHTCSRCDSVYLDAFVRAKGHTPGEEATCTAAQLCTECATVLADALGHGYADTVVPPTCAEQGYTSHVCTYCGHTYVDSIQPAAGHTAGAEATCTSDQTCTVCYTVLTAKLGHVYTDTVVPPTCAEQGYTVHDCSRCKTAYLDAYVEAKGHTPGEAATCTAPQLCTECTTSLTPATGHAYTETVIDPTCTEQGYTDHTCSHCNHTYITDLKSATGHKAGSKSTCTTAQTCTVCNTLLNGKLGHDYVETVVEPTCTESGYTHHECSRCKIAYFDNSVEPLGHTVSDWIVDSRPGFGDAGRRHKSCSVCGITLEKETYWNDNEMTTEGDISADTSDGPSTPHETDAPDVEEGGCAKTAGSVAAIILVLVAAFLYWYIDSRRRHR